MSGCMEEDEDSFWLGVEVGPMLWKGQLLENVRNQLIINKSSKNNMFSHEDHQGFSLREGWSECYGYIRTHYIT